MSAPNTPSSRKADKRKALTQKMQDVERSEAEKLAAMDKREKEKAKRNGDRTAKLNAAVKKHEPARDRKLRQSGPDLHQAVGISIEQKTDAVANAAWAIHSDSAGKVAESVCADQPNQDLEPSRGPKRTTRQTTLAGLSQICVSDGQGSLKFIQAARRVGTARRRTTTKYASHAVDANKFAAQLVRLGVINIPRVEEVNMFKEDGTVIHFATPKVHASVSANTYMIIGHGEEKRLEELLPGIINQLGLDNLIKRIDTIHAASEGAIAVAVEDDDIPDIGEHVEDVSKS